MPDPSRLQQLQAQRELVARHLAWLDQEIVAASGTPTLTPTPAAPTPPVPTEPPPPTAAPKPAPGTVGDVDAMLDDLLQSDDSNKPPISKTGCWLIFAALMVLGCGLTLAAIYFFWG
ncbi:hypothetical protein [Actomonas aquatica]|uniref:Uncharacterized protein n=1 Tax=Actomonas aquatica TaxID=2866162 RepID=A0ABZ1CCJ3_9BACT|nr:hypothetical protein [Opitutus sp. WL0086]WRQ88020.1 hypothetical protein K1X11_001275 [Opitutus sp. WL0086]